jgi:hypothetical protein
MAQLIAIRKPTFRQRVGEIFSVLFGFAFFALLAWIGLRVVWFLI